MFCSQSALDYIERTLIKASKQQVSTGLYSHSACKSIGHTTTTLFPSSHNTAVDSFSQTYHHRFPPRKSHRLKEESLQKNFSARQRFCSAKRPSSICQCIAIRIRRWGLRKAEFTEDDGVQHDGFEERGVQKIGDNVSATPTGQQSPVRVHV